MVKRKKSHADCGRQKQNMEDLNNTIYMAQYIPKQSSFSDYNVLQFEISY